MSKNGRRFITKTSQGIETFKLPEQAPNGPVVLERLPGYLPTAMQNVTPLALSFDGNMMLALDHNGNINLYVWVGVEWKQHVTVVTGGGDVADISRDGTYI